MLNREFHIGPGILPRAVGSVLFVVLLVACLAQQFPMGQFRDFSLPEYHAAPHATQMKSLLQGAEAVPKGKGRILIRKLKLETFRVDGTSEFIMRADDCLYDSKQRTAVSPGLLEMRTANGQFLTKGEGFLWRQNESSLTISNQVHTVIRLGQTRALLQP